MKKLMKFAQECWSRFWRMLTAIRNAVANLILLVVMLLIGAVFIREPSDLRVAPGTLLTLHIEGRVLEAEPVVERRLQFVRQFVGSGPETASLHEITESLRLAAQDENIAGVILGVEDMTGAGLATIATLGAAIDEYREKTKRPVWVYADNYTQGQYAVAAHADRIGIHPMGAVLLKGFSGSGLYWGKFLKDLGVGVSVYKAGAFKSAPEPFVVGGPSEESLAVQKMQLDEAWGSFTAGIERARGMMPGTAARFASDLPERFSMPSVKPSEAFREAGFVTDVIDRGAFERAIAKAFTTTGRVEDVKFVDYRTYFASHSEAPSEASVAVVFAEGEISDVPGMGGIVARELTALLDEAADAPGTRALILRINSPGGDAVAAETIRAKLEEIRGRGLPVIVSMGDYAASGGYWISTAADKIIAHPQTVTGSIGVFSIVPNVEGVLERWNIGFEGYRTTPLADLGSVMHSPTDAEAALYQAGVSRVYAEFKRLTAVSRGMEPDAVEKIAQGRVWFGARAKTLGLVDGLGTLEDALRVARSEANLSENASVAYWMTEGPGLRASLAALIGRAATDYVGLSAVNEVGGPTTVFVRRAADGSGAPLVWTPERIRP